MSKSDPKIIRVGDKVRIKFPAFFIRCGYPVSKDDCIKTIESQYSEKINEFIESFPFIADIKKTPFSPGVVYTKIFNEICDAIAYGYLHSKKFGGNQRRIFQEFYGEYKDLIARVTKIKYFRTGTYISGSNYGQEDDYDPARLTNVETEKILYLEPRDIVDVYRKRPIVLAINVRNVEKIDEYWLIQETAKRYKQEEL